MACSIRRLLKSAFLCTQAVVPAMRKRKWGRIVNISSIAAQNGGILVGPQYVASKAGMLGLTRYYAGRLVREGITVNSTAPALIETDLIKSFGVSPDVSPIGRFGTPEEHAALVLMLVRNGYMTGQTVGLNGGLYIT